MVHRETLGKLAGWPWVGTVGSCDCGLNLLPMVELTCQSSTSVFVWLVSSVPEILFVIPVGLIIIPVVLVVIPVVPFVIHVVLFVTPVVLFLVLFVIPLVLFIVLFVIPLVPFVIPFVLFSTNDEHCLRLVLVK